MLLRSCKFFAATAAIGCLLQLPGHALTAAPAQPTQPAKPQSIAEKIAASKDLLDINTASPAQLSALPGMGKVYTERVIAGRPYSAKNQLLQRGVLPEDEYLKIRDSIIAHRVKK